MLFLCILKFHFFIKIFNIPETTKICTNNCYKPPAHFIKFYTFSAFLDFVLSKVFLESVFMDGEWVCYRKCVNFRNPRRQL